MIYQDPYLSLPQDQCFKTSFTLDARDRAFLSSVRPQKGTLQITLAILVKKLIELIKTNGIRDYDPERFERLVAGVTLVTTGQPDTAGPVATDEAVTRNDGRGVTELAQQATRVVNATADTKGHVVITGKKGTKAAKVG
jgi:hypothetical protein